MQPQLHNPDGAQRMNTATYVALHQHQHCWVTEADSACKQRHAHALSNVCVKREHVHDAPGPSQRQDRRRRLVVLPGSRRQSSSKGTCPCGLPRSCNRSALQLERRQSNALFVRCTVRNLPPGSPLADVVLMLQCKGCECHLWRSASAFKAGGATFQGPLLQQMAADQHGCTMHRSQ